MNIAMDELLLQRMRNILLANDVSWTEKKMFGGTCFMVEDKMCFGTYQGGLMVRIDPEEADILIDDTEATQMIHGGRPMKGYLFINHKDYQQDSELEFWINKCIEFNPKAKSSKKKK